MRPPEIASRAYCHAPTARSSWPSPSMSPAYDALVPKPSPGPSPVSVSRREPSFREALPGPTASARGARRARRTRSRTQRNQFGFVFLPSYSSYSYGSLCLKPSPRALFHFLRTAANSVAKKPLTHRVPNISI